DQSGVSAAVNTKMMPNYCMHRIRRFRFVSMLNVYWRRIADAARCAASNRESKKHKNLFVPFGPRVKWMFIYKSRQSPTNNQSMDSSRHSTGRRYQDHETAWL